MRIDQVEHDLIARHYLVQRQKWRGLSLDAAHLQHCETTVDAHRLNERWVADPPVEIGPERGQIQAGGTAIFGRMARRVTAAKVRMGSKSFT